jgi:predicted O-linked N-acetylglucosamine transferase (SPINDLY family)
MVKSDIQELLEDYLATGGENITLEQVETFVNDPDPLNRRIAYELLYNLTGDARNLLKIIPVLKHDAEILWDFLNDYCSEIEDPYVVSVLIIEALKHIDPLKEKEKAENIILSWKQLNQNYYILPENKDVALKIKDIHLLSLPAIANTIAGWIAMGVRQPAFYEFDLFPYFLSNHSRVMITIPQQFMEATKELTDSYLSNYQLGVLSVLQSDLDAANRYFIEAARAVLSRNDPENAFNIIAKWHMAATVFLDKRPELLAALEDILWKTIHDLYLNAGQSLQAFVMSIFLYCDIASKLIGSKYFNHDHILELSQLFEKKLTLFKNKYNMSFNLKPQAKDRLNIGYMGLSINDGPSGSIVNTFIQHHNKDKFNVFFYDCGFAPHVSRNNRNKIENHCTIRSLEYKNLEDKLVDAVNFARQIYEDKIDVLIYENWLINPVGHTICCLKPAPVILRHDLTGISTGLSKVPHKLDYLGVASSSTLKYSEKLIPMPLAFPPVEKSKVGKTRGDYDIPEEAIILYASKPGETGVKGEFVDGIIQLLKANTGTYFLYSMQGDLNQIHKAFTDHQVVDRVRYAGPDFSRENLQALIEMSDIYLNPFPVSSQAEVYYAMISGCPVVAMQGKENDLFAVKIGAAMVEEETLIVNSVEEYLKKANMLINSSHMRVKLGDKLQRRAEKVFALKPVVDEHEALYRKLYNQVL